MFTTNKPFTHNYIIWIDVIEKLYVFIMKIIFFISLQKYNTVGFTVELACRLDML